ncbi:MAG TPA: hypothetical protein PKO05_05805 [Thermoanaerobaculia bacterium]|jgi:hypothetical protein|nr:hypothetical protein [Thermoanaerobaculia bacterium]MBP7812214.1 hypothetical protein [Thermoanaerobaculia bacterium]HNU82925.1 hypothetical protein [Thermoanaerobaculia bacterium]HPA94837.1 hypothetical protein [Thermoanaerobaculia bacterium]HQN38895.1 hypothetical protein [Thermoanaerobaculia bacterium]
MLPHTPARRLVRALVLVPLVALLFGALPAFAASGELVGLFARAEIEAALPDWGAALGDSDPDPEAAAALLALPAGPRVVVLFGSWCSDSRHELTRLWNAFDLAGGEPRFEIVYVGVDRAKAEPAAWVEGRDLRFVPTFYVERDGREVGRIVESSPHGIESDLLALLTGERQGVVSARDDLAP